MNERINSLLKSTYRDKGTDFSSSQLCKPDYQLWADRHTEGAKRSDMVGFKSYLGSAMHLSFEVQDIISVIQEFSHIKEFEGVTIGGTCDRLDWIASKGKWELGDYKLKGSFSYKLFMEGERDKEILQLSIYRWLFKGLYDIADEATIYLFMNGHTAREKYPEYQEVTIQLLSIDETEAYIKRKIAIALSDEAPRMDCTDSWAKICDYCDLNGKCDATFKEANEGFSDES